MPNPKPVKECDIFKKANKGGKKTPKTASDETGSEGDKMAIAEVLSELKALRSEFGSKLDVIDGRLDAMSNSISALEDKFSDIRRDVSSNEKRIDEAETRISDTDDTLHHMEASLAAAMKRIAQLESKTEDLENRGRRKNIRLFGLKEGAEGSRSLFDFVREKLPVWLGQDPSQPPVLERVHRTLGDIKPDQHRAVLIRFLNFREKELVLRLAKNRNITHDESKIYLTQDLSAETIRRRRKFDSVKQLFLDMGTFRGFHPHPCRLRVLHEEKIRHFSSPEDAEDFYRSIAGGGCQGGGCQVGENSTSTEG